MKCILTGIMKMLHVSAKHTFELADQPNQHCHSKYHKHAQIMCYITKCECEKINLAEG